MTIQANEFNHLANSIGAWLRDCSSYTLPANLETQILWAIDAYDIEQHTLPAMCEGQLSTLPG